MKIIDKFLNDSYLLEAESSEANEEEKLLPVSKFDDPRKQKEEATFLKRVKRSGLSIKSSKEQEHPGILGKKLKARHHVISDGTTHTSVTFMNGVFTDWTQVDDFATDAKPSNPYNAPSGESVRSLTRFLKINDITFK